MSKVIWIVYESAVNMILNSKNQADDSGCMYVDRIRGYSETRKGARELMRKIRDQYCSGHDIIWDYEGHRFDYDTHDFCHVEDDYGVMKYAKSYYLKTDSVLTEIILP